MITMFAIIRNIKCRGAGLLLALVFIATVLGARAQDNLGNTQFNRSSFVDSNFGRRPLKNLIEDQAPRDKSLDVPREVEGTKIDDIAPSFAGNRLHAFGEPASRKELQQTIKPVMELLQDWVPDKMDPVNNGGFGVAPDSGSPVPYRLNGHLDLQRGLPWEAQP